MESYAHIKPYLQQVETAMESDLAKEDPRVYGMLIPFIKRGGKRIRPILAFLSCGATGGKYESVVDLAAVIELFHNFTLVHDDIEDNSQFRRGEPALHITHGIPMALNSGDALYTLLWKKLVHLRMPPKNVLELQFLCADAFKRVVDGQGIELEWIGKGRFDVSAGEYFDMIGGKTAALMGLSCEAGAFAAGADLHQRHILRDFGEKIGIAFQIQDDVLNVSGDFESYQKEIGGDISEGKRTLMVVHCLKTAEKKDRKRLVSILSSHSRKKEDVDAAIALLKNYGSVDHARRSAESLVAEAKALLASLPASKDKDALLGIADYVIRREK